MIALDPILALSQQDRMNLHDLIVQCLSDYPIDTAGLTYTTVQVTVANTVHFCSGGVAKSKTTASVGFTATVHDIIADPSTSQERTYLIGVNASGTLSIMAGAQAAAGASLMPERSSVTAGVALLGKVVIAIAAGTPGSGTNFVAGTTALNDARLTGSAATYTNFIGPGACMPLFSAAR